MKELPSSPTSSREDRSLLRSYQFAWLLVIGLTFAGSIYVEVALNDLTASLILAGISVVGLVAQDVYFAWANRDVPLATEEKKQPPARRNNIFHIIFVMIVWIIPDISEGRLSLRSGILAVASGVTLAAFLWWQQAHSPFGKRTAQ